jgi:apolipoprotein N-acyltransferase
MDETNIKFGKREIAISIVVIIILFFAVLFGITGIRTIFTIFFLFFLPFFLILHNFDIEMDEKIIFSIILGFGFFSTLTYWLGFAIGSLKISTGIIFCLLIAVGQLIRILKKKIKL